MRNKNLRDSAGCAQLTGSAFSDTAHSTDSGLERKPLLRVPPFPGARLQQFAAGTGAVVDPAMLARRMKALRVGGSFWGAQPELPKGYVVVRSTDGIDAATAIAPQAPVVLWEAPGRREKPIDGVAVITGDCDPWHVLSDACAVIAGPGDELRVIAALMHVPCYNLDLDGGPPRRVVDDLSSQLEELSASAFANPFTGATMDALEAAELCGFWRGQIDSNRDIAGAIGFAFWKQDHVSPLLWDGSRRTPFLRSTDGLKPTASVAVWRTRTSAAVIDQIEREGRPVVEVEDGFLRSRGLGADCIPPLSITVDRLGAHFDPSKPSELELLLQDGRFDAQLIERASELRRVIVEAGLGKYDQSTALVDRPAGDRRHILVPGQVEDDRSIQLGGCGLTSNLDLLARVRGRAPDAYILYKPHPDVLAGHRVGAVSEAACLRYADRIVSDLPIASLIEMVDEVHVNTSLAGFEALMRGKSVTTHGVPFYAGWGLTHDLGPVPERRSARRTIDEVVAAALLLYPRYIDPVTGLPCPAETIVDRLKAATGDDVGMVVGVRRLQGRLMRRLRRLVQ